MKKYSSIQDFFNERVPFRIKIKVKLQFILLDIINKIKKMKKTLNILIIIASLVNIYYWFGARYNMVAVHMLLFMGLTYVFLELNIKTVNKIGNKIFKK